MESALAATTEKMKWAREHTRELATLTNAWLKANPYELRSDFYPDVNVVAVTIATENPPLRFGVMAGNIVYQLRSILDHLVCQLVVANGQEPTSVNQFPVYTPDRKVIKNAAHFDQVTRDGVLLGVREEHRAAIELFQPYHRQDWATHPLAVLQRLNNIDKHNLLLAAAHRGDPNHPTYLTVGTPATAEDVSSVDLVALLSLASGRLYQGAVVAVYEVVPDGPDPKVHMHGNASRYITFANADYLPLISGIHWMAQCVGEIITGFSPVLGNPNNPVLTLLPGTPLPDPPAPTYETEPLDTADLIFQDFFASEDSE